MEFGAYVLCFRIPKKLNKIYLNYIILISMVIISNYYYQIIYQQIKNKNINGKLGHLYFHKHNSKYLI